MGQEPDNGPKIVDLSEARKKQQSQRVDPSGRKALPHKNKSKQTAPQRSIWTYLQFALFLGAIFYFMQLCSPGGLF
jgi:hypothetical protein